MKSTPSIFTILIFLSSVAQAESPQAPAKVFGKPVQASELSESLSFPARIVSKINTAILAEGDGVVSMIQVSLGQRVTRRGQLMQIQNTDPVFNFQPIPVTAPITGLVSSIEVSEGAQVTKGQKLASVTDPAKLKIVVEVPAEDRLLLKPGMPGEFRFGNGDAIQVKIRGLSPFVDPATGTSTCEFDLDNPGNALASGLVGRINVATRSRNVIQVPDAAIIYRSQLPYVRLVKNGKIQYAKVKLGKKQNERYEIIEGLKDGDVVVERSSRYVAEGDIVEIDLSQKVGSSQ